MDTVGATAPLTTILWDRLAASIHFNAQHDSRLTRRLVCSRKSIDAQTHNSN